MSCSLRIKTKAQSGSVRGNCVCFWSSLSFLFLFPWCRDHLAFGSPGTVILAPNWPSNLIMSCSLAHQPHLSRSHSPCFKCGAPYICSDRTCREIHALHLKSLQPQPVFWKCLPPLCSLTAVEQGGCPTVCPALLSVGKEQLASKTSHG